MNNSRFSFLIGTLILGALAPAARSAPAGDPAERRSLLDEWKASADAPSNAAPALDPLSTGGTAVVGRASMVVNGEGDVAYTRNYLGLDNNCDVDLGFPNQWKKLTQYQAGDHVRIGAYFYSDDANFMAQNSGTSGSSKPAFNPVFGSTIHDGSVTWICVGVKWGPGLAYTSGMTVINKNGGNRPGFTYQAQNSGTSGNAEPLWPIVAGGTVNDHGIAWKAIGFFPGSFRGCNPLQLVRRTARGDETVIASEGDAVGTAQLMGWGEFIAMNESGRVAFKAEAIDLLNDRDEGGSGIFLAGPDAGALTKVATSGDVIGGRFTCGFSSMVGVNDAGQVVFDGLSVSSRTVWQSLHSYTQDTQIHPTVPNGLTYVAQDDGMSGSAEPAFPTALGAKVQDGSITWVAQSQHSYPSLCDEDNHGLIRFTPGTGNQLLAAIGSHIGGSTVAGFGSDINNASAGNRCTTCGYEDIDGRINSAGHVPVVLKLSDGTQGLYILNGPGDATEVTRTKGGGLFSSLYPRAAINDADQVAFKGAAAGAQKIYRFTPPSTFDRVAGTGDDVGTRSGGSASGVKFESFGNFLDMNSSGNLVFSAKLSGTQEGFYFWNGTTGVIQQILRSPDNNKFASEMITVNDEDLVALVTGSTPENRGGSDSDDDHAEGSESGAAYFWRDGTLQKQIGVGDVVGGDSVTSIYAQHQSFARRQLSSAGCLALTYHVLGDEPGFDCTEGGVLQNPCYGEGGGVVKGGQLFISCAPSSRVRRIPTPGRPATVTGR